MEISNLSQSLSVVTARAAGTPAAAKSQSDAPAVDNRIRALDALRAELRMSLKARFFAGFSQPAPAFSSAAPPAAASDVAQETVNAAKQAAGQAPGRATRSLTAFRATVNETVESVRETFQGRGDVRDVDTVASLVNRGIDDLSAATADQAESATRVLDVESRLREASTIRIRTQEGDEVTIRLRNVEQFTASDVSASGPNGEATRTRIEASQASRISFSVEGDINDDERIAIGQVVAQATEIADEFFDGDLSFAFETAAAFQFDTDQLQRVNLRFRVQEDVTMRYAEQISTPQPERQAPAETVAALLRPESKPAPVMTSPAPVVAPVTSGPAEPVELPRPADIKPVEAPTSIDAEDTPVRVAAPEPAQVNTDALNSFFSMISSFLRETTVAFELAGESSRFYFSESFKLTLLRETLVTQAPEEKTDAAATAAGVVDRLLEVNATAAEDGATG
jgi:hypothetical protein